VRAADTSVAAQKSLLATRPHVVIAVEILKSPFSYEFVK
jgi:hypothetical protein